jgi:triphosphatase
MTEVELKFQVPPASRAAVQRAVATGTAVTTRLRARYFDTPDRRLAAAGIALRLRLEGSTWVQTLKAAGSGLAVRLEHEVPLPRQRGVPTLDISRHDASLAAAPLQAALAGAPPLQLVFETDIRRTHRVLRSAGGQVELALDQGHIAAAGRRLPVWELEFELRSGSLPALVGLAQRWVQRHGLWLDPRTKSERGHLLAAGLACSPAAGATVPQLQPGQSVDQGLRRMVAAALAQVLPNAAVLADEQVQASPEHLHQLRVGLRRLRSMLRLFGGEHAGADALWQPQLAELFRQLGASRDLDVWAATLQPALAAAGGPALVLPADAADTAIGPALRDARTHTLWLELLAYAEADAPAVDGDPALRQAAGRQLQRLHRRLSQLAAAFDTLDAPGRHRLRRRIKLLRYGVEATAALWPAKAQRRYLAALRGLQDELGACNDVQVALDRLQAWPQPDAGVWFARGWLAARHAHLQERAAAELKRWPDGIKAWRHKG